MSSFVASSKFSVLARTSSHSSISSESCGEIANADSCQNLTGLVSKDANDGYLPAFFHNNKSCRHLAKAVASHASQQADRVDITNPEEDLQEGEQGERLREKGKPDEDHEEQRSQINDVSDVDGEGESRKSRISKKAAKRAARKQAKATKQQQQQQDAKNVACLDACSRQVQCTTQKDVDSSQFDGASAFMHGNHQAQGGSVASRRPKKGKRHPAGIMQIEGSPYMWEIPVGFVPDMRAPARFFADETLANLCFEEIEHAGAGFLPAVRQLANVATLPGLVGCSLGMPDIHSGYGFAVGSVAATDLDDPDAVISPGGVGFDINCGVRLLRTSLHESEIKGSLCAKLATALFDSVPSGVGAHSASFPKNERELQKALEIGMRWALDKGLCWQEDLERTEEGGAMPGADSSAVSSRALKRGSPQLGTLGSGNHYLEIQVVDEIYKPEAAKVMGLDVGRVCVMIHCGSRGLGHQVCTDYLQSMEGIMKKQGISVPDRQLCCVRASSSQGQQYLKGMAAAANYAFVNRTLIAHAVREVFGRVMQRDPKHDLQMHMVYDVCHNIAKQERHTDPKTGQTKRVLVHRKGATRSFPPGHEALPLIYRAVGQPVLIGGSMGTCSYVLVGGEKSMELSFGSTCHGAGRRMSRSQAMRELSGPAVLGSLQKQGIEVRVASPKLVAEEADASYKDVTSVVRTCDAVGISALVARLRPLAVIKG